MHNLGIGDLALKHPLDLHRPSGYTVPEVIYEEEPTTFQNEAMEATTIAETITTTGMCAIKFHQHA